ncbi:MAG: hypothetical protein GY835_17175 [bacterium]|nr:hypothetical protein [bacterium]
MSRRMIACAALAAIGIAFGCVSLLVYLSNGHPRLIARKLKLGAIILSLTAMLGTACTTPSRVTCYMPAPPDRVAVDPDAFVDNVIWLVLAESNEIAGTILDRDSSEFSFCLIDAEVSVIQEGELAAQDGAMDEAEEEFTIVIDPGTPVGGYALRFYSVPMAEIVIGNYIAEFPVEIRETSGR